MRSWYLKLAPCSAVLWMTLAVAQPVQIDEQALQQAVASSLRSDENRARDKARHPVETLSFFDVEQDMTVLELWPVRGWYTEILGPYLKDRGQLIVANFSQVDETVTDKKERYFAKLGEELAQRIAAEPDFGPVQVIEYEPRLAMPAVADNSVDRVLTFRNTHNWLSDGVLNQVCTESFRVLKPGGVLGIVEHRGVPIGGQLEFCPEGYVNEQDLITAMESCGFQLQGRAEINANPLDTKNHPRGVFSLPPTLAMGEYDREKYLAIGESDRMTLKFVKPEPVAVEHPAP